MRDVGRAPLSPHEPACQSCPGIRGSGRRTGPVRLGQPPRSTLGLLPPAPFVSSPTDPQPSSSGCDSVDAIAPSTMVVYDDPLAFLLSLGAGGERLAMVSEGAGALVTGRSELS